MLQTKCLLESHTLHKLIAVDSFPMNNSTSAQHYLTLVYRFAYFLKLLDGTPYSKQHKYGIAMRP